MGNGGHHLAVWSVWSVVDFHSEISGRYPSIRTARRSFARDADTGFDDRNEVIGMLNWRDDALEAAFMGCHVRASSLGGSPHLDEVVHDLRARLHSKTFVAVWSRTKLE